jgi:nucleotide-binding universal stress UspA family protein
MLGTETAIVLAVMNKRVLLAIDMEAPAAGAASYAVQLAARLKLDLAVMAIFPARRGRGAAKTEVSLEDLNEDQRLWLGRVRERCQQEGVPVEIFVSSGSFMEEVLRFSNSQSAMQFIVMGLDCPPGGHPRCSPPLKNLSLQFEGEVLLVRGQGKVMRLTDLCRENHGREN